MEVIGQELCRDNMPMSYGSGETCTCYGDNNLIFVKAIKLENYGAMACEIMLRQ